MDKKPNMKVKMNINMQENEFLWVNKLSHKNIKSNRKWKHWKLDKDKQIIK